MADIRPTDLRAFTNFGAGDPVLLHGSERVVPLEGVRLENLRIEGLPPIEDWNAEVNRLANPVSVSITPGWTLDALAPEPEEANVVQLSPEDVRAISEAIRARLESGVQFGGTVPLSYPFNDPNSVGDLTLEQIV